MAKKGRKVIIRVAHPKMKKYLKDHPYMEPDGMQEGETQDIDEAVRKRGDEYVYVSKKGKVLGRHKTRKAAEKQAKAIFISRNMGESNIPEPERKILLRIKKQLQKSAKKHARQARQATDIAKASQKSSDLHRDQVDQLDAMTEDNLEEKRGATPAYCRRTPCKDMGFTQKASCKSQGVKDCYRGKKKNEQVELQERCQKGYKTHPTRKTKIMFGKRYRNCVKAEEQQIAEADPKKGTGKKPKGSGRRLYTDENPKDTVSVKFSSVSAIRDTLSKASFKAKSHKRQSQIINLIHQRVRAAYNNAKDPKVKARLKKAFDYAKKRKEASKKKTIRLRKSKK